MRQTINKENKYKEDDKYLTKKLKKKRYTKSNNKNTNITKSRSKVVSQDNSSEILAVIRCVITLNNS